MPDIPLLKGTGKRQRIVGWLSVTGDYKPGDSPPSGYNDWHEWARIQTKAGLKQKRCSQCSRWRFPQEIATTEMRPYVAYKTKRDAQNETNPVVVNEEVVMCNECAAKEAEQPKEF